MKIHGKTAAEIFDCVRTLTQSRQLLPGTSLPPVRDLALELGINRNTVAAAYKRLAMAGIAVTQGRLGTIIRDQYEPGEQEGTLAGSPLTDLASGNPNIEWLPDISAALKSRPYKPRLYGEPTVNAGLEAYVRKWFEPDCPAPFEVNLAHGAVDAIERLLNAYLVAGDKVAVENPCFLSSINTLRAIGLQPIGVPVDAEGIQAEGLANALAKGAQAVILTPRAHNPTGCCLSEKRARAISRLLAKHPNVPVIVDDHFALLSGAAYHPVIPRSTYRWAVVRSFTKALGPDLRVAAVASDVATSRQLRLCLAPGTSWVSHLLQDIVEVTVTRPETIRLIDKARNDYARRRQAMEQALDAQGIGHMAQGDGFNLWVPLQCDDQAIALALARQGWLVRQGSVFSVQDGVRGLRITISAIEPAQCERLAQDIRRSLG
ncbi:MULTISPECIES: MocR-like B6 salvage transcription factor PtsJ [Cupriavidus]|uniref:MocR-like B6 salvage transcription factor PtsJ n=1 Tax=Cupriavidus TaxID=106589 RepID=UPI0002A32074|nr:MULTISPECIES: transcriptional regulator PtsJ [Cupriavidus]EKZ97881.1 transcriptional regulatory protein PtsJ [Cupriavidus sp. HMR-1]